MKILHLLSQRPDSTGSGIYLQAMLREAASRGHKNYLVAGIQSHLPPALGCIDEKECRFVKFSDADIAYNIVGMSDVMPYESTRFCDLSTDDLVAYERSFSTILTDAVDTFQPDIIHSHHLWIVSSLTRRLFPDIPVVTTCHGTDLRQFQNCGHLQQKVLSGCRKIDAVMALSEVQKREIVQRYDISSNKIFVVGAGYNDSLFFHANKPVPVPVQLVYAGKLCNAKGVPWFLEALGEVNSPAWQLHLAGSGSGEEKDNCLQMAALLGKRVTVHGAVPQEQLAGIMRQSHIFVLPSFFEGLPLVLLEAIASGCRIVATELPGVAEVLGDVRENFIDLVQMPRLHQLDRPWPEDEAVYTKHLTQALRRQISAARDCPNIDLSNIEDKIASFSWSGIFQKVQAVYNSVVRK